MRHRRPPVVGEALEVGQRKRLQVLPRKAHDAEQTQRIEQQGNLVRREPLPQVDADQATPGAAGRQRPLATRLWSERPAQFAVEVLLFDKVGYGSQ